MSEQAEPTERQRDQQWVEDQRAENVRKAEADNPDWAGVKL